MKELTTSELKAKIRVLTDRIELSRIMIKVWTERGDDGWLKSREKEQQDIIAAAMKRLAELRGWHDNSEKKINELRASIRYDEREQKLLKHRRDILRLLELQQKVNAMKLGDSEDCASDCGRDDGGRDDGDGDGRRCDCGRGGGGVDVDDVDVDDADDVDDDVDVDDVDDAGGDDGKA